MTSSTKGTRATLAKGLGVAAGAGSLLTAGLHQGWGGAETAQALTAAQGQVPALYLVQIEAVWAGATLVFVLLGLGLVLAGLRRPGWLWSLGRPAAVWFLGLAAAFVWVGPRWGYGEIAPQVFLLLILAALAAAAAWAGGPRSAKRP